MKIFVIILFMMYSLNIYTEEIYFPPQTGEWETITPESLNWDTEQIDSLYNYLDSKNSKAFILLKDGKIVLEKYFDSFTKDSNWYWASAGKTLTSALVGIAQEEGYLNISDKTSKYLGEEWTSCQKDKEDLITIRHQLTMTSGLDDAVEDSYCTNKECLNYKADAGNRWAYHNAPYTLLDKIIQSATGKNFNMYFSEVIKNKIGMNGLWVKQDYNNLYISTPRSMARYGILLLNRGIWDNERIIPDLYYNEMVNTSQSINQSYGYLCWLNGKESYMAPQTQYVFQGMLFPNAPADVFAALGKNGQCLNICPSKGIVFVRMGEAPGSALEVPWTYNNEIWQYLNHIMRTTDVKNGLNVRSEFFIYPNPANDYIEINSESYPTSGRSCKSEIEIYNIFGECVMLTETTQATSLQKINIPHLPVGLYFVQIGNYSDKFMVVR